MSGTLLSHGDDFPEVHETAFVAPGAFVIGAVVLGEQASVWYGAVLRGDTEPIKVGARSNIQDGCVLHADPGYPAIIGSDCVIGHRAILHGCEVGEGSLIGMGATVLNGAKIGEGSIVAAGALVPEGKEYPPRSLIVGVPARRVKEVTEEQRQGISRGVRNYIERSASHASRSEAG